jgi:hypothetical protein
MSIFLILVAFSVFRVSGQAATTVYGQGGSFTTNTQNNGGVTASSLNTPDAIAVDASNGLYAADFNNNRVLYFQQGSTTATRVYGQGGSFTSNTQNNGGVTGSSLLVPKGLGLDSSGNLYVADTGNNRVLFFASGSTTATKVYGQGGNFNQNLANNGGISADSLKGPFCVRADKNNNVYVCDTQNNRVLFYSSSSTTASRVYGTGGSFTVAGVSSTTSSTFSNPQDIAFDSNNNIYISDSGNGRVLIFTGTSTTASSLIGQTSFTSVITGCTANILGGPMGIIIDQIGNLYVGDGNARVLMFPPNATSATKVYGAGGSFTSCAINNGGLSASSLNRFLYVATDSNGKLYVSDSSNNRILYYGSSSTTSSTTSPAMASNIEVCCLLITLFIFLL